MLDRQTSIRLLKARQHSARSMSIWFLTVSALSILDAALVSGVNSVGAWMSWMFLAFGVLLYLFALNEALNYRFWTAMLERAENPKRWELMK